MAGISKAQARRSTRKRSKYQRQTDAHNNGLSNKAKRIAKRIAAHKPSTKTVHNYSNPANSYGARQLNKPNTTRPSGAPQPGWKLSLVHSGRAVPVNTHGKRSTSS